MMHLKETFKVGQILWSDEKFLFPFISYKVSLDDELCF